MSDTGFIMINIPSLYDYTYNIINLSVINDGIYVYS